MRKESRKTDRDGAISLWMLLLLVVIVAAVVWAVIALRQPATAMLDQTADAMLSDYSASAKALNAAKKLPGVVAKP